ncbi:hypothetical protein NBRC116583_21030 [Arenicella sp. 4NH20-0111]|uniref:hypothetical protein n=1 Tax=Arenicella sp. 4NH20-0111 TaxID=3127648 RepID=UPI0031026F07
MKSPATTYLLGLILFIAFHNSSFALTAQEFHSICGSSNQPCNQNGILQAYIGGALDAIAVLDEQTDYLDSIYCKPPKQLFSVEKIIVYINENSHKHPDRNAMILLVDYLEKNGGC